MQKLIHIKNIGMMSFSVKLSILMTVLFVIIGALSGQVTAQIAKCNYEYSWISTPGIKPTNQTYYACVLNANQTNNGKEITTIKGQYAGGYSDANVEFLYIYKGYILKKFTSIFCHKFPNLEVIDMHDTATELLDVNSLSSCSNLKYLSIGNNKLRQLPENLLVRNSKLIKLYFAYNRLTALPESLFLNLKELEDLSLNDNQMNFLSSNIFRPLVKLKVLYLSNNKLQSINPAWFVTLQNLRWMRLDNNQILQISSKCFASLKNLEKLWLHENRIKTLNSDSFHGLQNLQILRLEDNEISNLPVGAFTQLRSLQLLSLFNNKLTTIHSDSFGIHNQLTKVYLDDNKINAFEPKLIDNTAVSVLNMTNNICSQLLIRSRSEIKSSLKKCFDNYRPRKQQQNPVQTYIKPSSPAQKKIICGQQLIGHGNIIGGKPVNRGDFPWNAALEKINGQFFCGGSLVTNRKVVTAAHCIQDKGDGRPKLARDILVLLGVYNLKISLEVGRIVASVQNIKIHPDWNPNVVAFEADITVLVLENEVVFSQLIQPICLPRSNFNIEAMTKGSVVGYGSSEDLTKLHENIPKIIETPIHKNEDCFLKYFTLATLSSKRTFCGGTGTGTGVCKGDSGSGLIVKNGNAYYLRGIVSSSLRGGQYGCDVNAYSVFTDVTKYVDWIYSIPTSRFK